MGLDFVGRHKASENFLVSRDTYVGVQGPWGSFSLGRQNTPYKVATAKLDPFNHTLADADSIMGRTASGKDINHRFNNSLGYVSNEKDGFTWKLYLGVEDDVAGTSENQKEALNLSAHYAKGAHKVDLLIYGEQGGYTLSSAEGEAMAIKIAWRYSIEKHRFGLAVETFRSDVEVNQRDAGMFSYRGEISKGHRLLAQVAVALESERGQDKAHQWSVGWSHDLLPKV